MRTQDEFVSHTVKEEHEAEVNRINEEKSRSEVRQHRPGVPGVRVVLRVAMPDIYFELPTVVLTTTQKSLPCQLCSAKAVQS